MKDNKNLILVSVSLLAVLSFPAFAQTVDIDCTGQIDFGTHVACSSGSLRINPDGTVSTNGCLVTQAPASSVMCKVVVTGGLATQNVKVSFAAPSVTLQYFGEKIIFNDLRMQERGEPFIKTALTFTPLEVTSSVTIDIGGKVNFGSGQTAGDYNGKIIVNADFI